MRIPNAKMRGGIVKNAYPITILRKKWDKIFYLVYNYCGKPKKVKGDVL